MPEHFSINALIRRGWTKALIARVLGAEDFVAPNQQFPGRADTRLFSRRRVEVAELSAEFLKVQDRRFRDPAGAPRDGGLIEVRHGPDQSIALARWAAQTQAFIRDDDPSRRTLHRVTGWRPANRGADSRGERATAAGSSGVNPEPDPEEARPARIVEAKKPRPRR